MRSRTSLSLLVTALCLHGGGIIAGSRGLQDLSWPQGFAPKPDGSRQWVAHTVDAGAVRLRIQLPTQWTRGIPDPTDGKLFVARDLAEGFVLYIDPVEPSPFNLDQALTNQSVQDYLAGMRAKLEPRGYDVVAAGQNRIGKRLWLWHDSRMRSLGVFATVGSIGGGRVWSFTATPQGQRLTAECAVLNPRDATAAAIDAHTGQAGAVCAAILERLAVEPK